MIKIFCGEDSFESYKLAKETAANESKKLQAELKIIECDELDPLAFLQEVEGINMFSPTSVILAKRLLSNKKLTDLINERYNDLKSYEIIIWNEGKIDSRLSLVKKIKEDKCFFEFSTQKPWQIKKWMKERLSELGISLKEEQVEFILERFGTDKHLLSNEIAKIKLFCKSRRVSTISDSNLSSILGLETRGDIWTLLDAFGQRRRNLCLKEYQKLTKYEKQTQFVIVMLGKELNNIAQVIYAQTHNIDPKEIGLHPFVLVKTLKRARNFTWDEIVGLIDRLVNLDIAIKNGEVEEDIGLTLYLSSI